MPTQVTPLPTPPSRGQTSDAFIASADSFLGALPQFGTELTALSNEVSDNATIAADAAVSASAASTSALSAANVTKWISGTTYTQGQCAWSPANFITYRRKTSGAGTTDPSIDTTNWTPVAFNETWQRRTASFNAYATCGYIINTSEGSITMTLPATPSQGDTIKIKNPSGTFSANNLIIDGNGKLINGYDRMVIDTNYFSSELVYDVTDGWGL